MSARPMAGITRPFASLSAGLLARKGHARPAMRPQGYMMPGVPAPETDDLGWNDMGWSAPAGAPQPEPEPMPEVVRQQRELVAEFAPAPVVPAPEPLEPLKPVALKPVSRATGKARTAFTLRLDPERHLRLRIACATRGHSAQKLLVQALDQLLAGMPDIDPLARAFSASGEAIEPGGAE